jgi:hypothetical protein
MFLVRLWLRIRSATEVLFEQSEVTRFPAGATGLVLRSVSHFNPAAPVIRSLPLHPSLQGDVGGINDAPELVARDRGRIQLLTTSSGLHSVLATADRRNRWSGTIHLL